MKDDDLNFRSVVHRLLVQIQSPSRRSTLRRWAFQKPIMALASFRPSGVMVGRSLTAWFLASAFGPTPYSQCRARANRRISRLDAMPLSRQSCRCGVVVGVAEWEINRVVNSLRRPPVLIPCMPTSLTTDQPPPTMIFLYFLGFPKFEDVPSLANGIFDHSRTNQAPLPPSTCLRTLVKN